MNAYPGAAGPSWKRGLAKTLFWGWNVIFLALILLGFAPRQLPQMIKSVQSGITPPVFLVQTLVLIAVPVITTIIAVFFLRKDAFKLFALGYVVEWPLLLVLFFRFFAVREGNPAVTVLLVWLAVAEIAFLWVLLDRKLDQRAPFWRYARLAGLSLLFAGTIYAAIWLLFYVPPLAVMLSQEFINFFRFFGHFVQNFGSRPWYELPLAILSQMLMYFSLVLILIMPVSAPIIAGRAWLRSLRSTRQTSGRLAAALTALLPLALVLVILAVSMRQPQHRAFELLKDPPANAQQAQALVQKEQQIRAGLLNTYLASYRYLSSEGEVRYIKEIYKMTLGVTEEVAGRVELAHEFLLKPFLYDSVYPVDPWSPDNQVLRNEQREAAELYQRFFDRPINQGEREQIAHAVRSTQNTTEAELAWQSVDDREVHLDRQEVTIAEHGDWADVLIHEEYANRTYQRQEVVYYFNLPESAVVTGLWLGTNPDRSKAFIYQVAPRGAAQTVYREEVRYMHDPALIEQIGPRQYRLRVFPVEPCIWVREANERGVCPALHLWMGYRTVSVGGDWPMPQLAIKFNVFWDRNSTRLINAKPSTAEEDDWFPAGVAANNPPALAPHRIDFPDGTTVLARPAVETQVAALPADTRLAVVLDRSFSMRERAGDVSEALAGLAASGSAPDADIYLTSSQYRGEPPGRVGLASLNPNEVFYFGGQNAAELLSQFEALNEGRQYDLILVLTDGTGYELGEGNMKIAVPDAPLWVIHLGGGLPLGYDDPTQQAIQASGGGIASTVEEALARWAVSKEAPGRIDAVDGYLWETLPTGDAAAVAGDFPASAASAEDAGFAALAARRVILAEMAKNHGSLDALPILDQMHELAVEQSIVTPYSSMIVLVNQEQRDDLKKLSEQADRFGREVENIGRTGVADPLAVTGVPEPEEWLLLISAAIALAYVAWRKMGQRSAVI